MAGRVPPIELAQTTVTPLGEPAPPVFADATGARRRRLRRLSYAAGLLAAVLLLAFWAGLAGLGPP
ncbi:hypothetical protein [Actinoplanes sp. NPDC049802]|uniref:hypothetical protein n=1 Tax=Actinoplanes sp. NPDC049802 TaxID=3154742 RepID=UPI0033C3884A